MIAEKSMFSLQHSCLSYIYYLIISKFTLNQTKKIFKFIIGKNILLASKI